jgi:flagellar basal-body rod protein FlgB
MEGWAVPITDLPLFSMLRTRMQWHQERQRLLAENVANSETPNFRPRDLAPLTFEGTETPATSSLGLQRTEEGHIASADNGSSLFKSARFTGEVGPSGNAVNLEDEMIKVAANQMDYQAATTLYTKSLGLIKIAIGKK